jgi:Peptidase family C25
MYRLLCYLNLFGKCAMQVESKSTSECELSLILSFNSDDLRLEYSLIGVVAHLPECPTVGEPGSPALPMRVIRVALPPNTRLIDIDAKASKTAQISNEVLPIAPLQPLRPGITDQPHSENIPPYYRPDEEQRYNGYQQSDPRRTEKPFVEPFSNPPFVPANADLYAEATRCPIAQLVATQEEGLTSVATVKLNPVRLTPENLLEFSSQIELTLRYEPTNTGAPEPGSLSAVVSRSQAMRQIALIRLTVINPDMVIDYSDLFPIFNLGTDYLIITDNQQWNAETITPTGATEGNLVDSFERLAAWKRQRGLKSRVVTISNIVADRYGNFRQDSRDLQEVIRKFLKMAQAKWGVAWVLLGGDTDIVPIRRVAGGREGNVNFQTTNPPPDNTSFWTGSYLRMHVVNPGVWFGNATTNLLVRPDTGLLIPYDATSTSNSTTRGWYFTTDDTYSTRTNMPTNFVRVNGSAEEVNANLQFLYEWNTIPTDLYYSSLVGPQYNQLGKHDWDLVDNGVYGQHFFNNELDGINYTPTVSLGRAPVRDVAQADTFVDKVIAYEKCKRPDGTDIDRNWLQRVLLVSENWGGRLWISSTNSNPPVDNFYNHTTGQSYSLIKLSSTPDWDWSLLAYINDGDVRLLPYRTDAAIAGRGWYFAYSSTNLSPNVYLVPRPGGGFYSLLSPSQWIVVYGVPEELIPVGYIFNSTGLDGSLADQEQLREQMRDEMPSFSDIQRLYEDIVDMTPAQIAATPVELITTNGLRNALNAGPHIVSLSGHGNSDGCCRLSRDLADSLTNGYYTFIAYADSCLTNQLDGDAMSEHLLRNPNGGAVAYIGNTRFSWIGLGDDIQRRFFNQWSALGGNAHLGLLNDTRAELFNNFYWADGRWTVLALNLMGDPEMPLWWNRPRVFRIPDIYVIDRLKLIFDPPNPPDPLDPPIDLPYRKNWGLTYVHLQQGDREQLMVVQPNEQLDLPLTEFQPGMATLTVTRPGHLPIVNQIELSKSQQKRIWNNPLLIALLLLGLLLLKLIVF